MFSIEASNVCPFSLLKTNVNLLSPFKSCGRANIQGMLTPFIVPGSIF